MKFLLATADRTSERDGLPRSARLAPPWLSVAVALLVVALSACRLAPSGGGVDLGLTSAERALADRLDFASGVVRDPDGADITVLVFMDLSRPHAGEVHAKVRQLLESDGFRGRIRYLVKPVEVTQNTAGYYAALAAAEAERQGKLEAFLNALLAAPAEMTEAGLDAAVQAAGLDAAALDEALIEERGRDTVEAWWQLAYGMRAVESPAVFINGEMVQGEKAVADLERVAREERSRATEFARQQRGDAVARHLIARLDAIEPVVLMPDPSERMWVPVTAGDSAFGDPGAFVTLVTFVDPECPYSRSWLQTLAELHQAWGPHLRLVFKPFPIPGLFAHADETSRALAAARRQGKGWELLAAFVSMVEPLDSAQVDRAIRLAGLDVASTRQMMDSIEVQQDLRADAELSERLGVNATPTSFLNGVRIRGSQDRDRTQTLLTTERDRAVEEVQSSGWEGLPYAKLQQDANQGSPRLVPPRLESFPSAGLRWELSGQVEEEEPVFGTTVVLFVDYLDADSIASARALSTAMEAYGDRFALTVRPVPRPNDALSVRTAEALIEATMQGKGLQFHRQVLRFPNIRREADIEALARQASLDMGRFRTALRLRQHQELSLRAAVTAGEEGVVPPTIILGRARLSGRIASADIEEMLREAAAGE